MVQRSGCLEIGNKGCKELLQSANFYKFGSLH
jgi:hypothetical protein